MNLASSGGGTGPFPVVALIRLMLPFRLPVRHDHRAALLGLAIIAGAALPSAMAQLARGVPVPPLPPFLVADLLAKTIITSVSAAVALGSAIAATNDRAARAVWLSATRRSWTVLVPCLVPSMGAGLLVAVLTPACCVILSSANTNLAPGSGVDPRITVLASLMLTTASLVEGVLTGVIAYLLTTPLRARIPAIVLAPVVLTAVVRWGTLLGPELVDTAVVGLLAHDSVRVTGLLLALLFSVVVVQAHPIAPARRTTRGWLSNPPLVVLAVVRLTRHKTVATTVWAAVVYSGAVLVTTSLAEPGQRAGTVSGLAMVSVVAFAIFGASARGGLGPRVTVEHRHGGSPALVVTELWSAVAAILIPLLTACGVCASLLGVDRGTAVIWVSKCLMATGVAVLLGAVVDASAARTGHLAAAAAMSTALVIAVGRLGNDPTTQPLATTMVLAASAAGSLVHERVRWNAG